MALLQPIAIYKIEKIFPLGIKMILSYRFSLESFLLFKK